ncbi:MULTISPECIES: hypothetical protein [unclassified Microcoleus]|uniref:hypothetical protein n=1 Tax=unclassified Microcoleus TaxID=2642155 RepID=UPI0025F2F29B|nr:MULTISPECIES: hypothetical protein [unclassified Microcoleus]
MTDSSSLANALSEPLRQPFWWAALASVGIHGVLGVSAPTISNIIYGGGNSSKNIPGSVGFVQLTPAEAGRLPQTIPPRSSNKPFSIAPVPVPTSPKLAPPLPPPPVNLPALPPGMPPPGFFAPLDPPLPPLTAPAAPQSQTSVPTVKPPSLKTPTFIPQGPPSGLIFPPLPGNFDRNIPPPPPGVTGLPQLPGGTSEDEAETLKKVIASRGGLPLFPDGAPVFTPEFPIGGRNSGPDGVPKLTQKDPNKRNLIAETPEERIRRQQFDQGQQQLEQQGVPGSNLPNDRETLLAAANTYVALFNDFKKAYPDLEMTGPTPVTVAYPKEACSQKLEGTAVFGAVVSPQGLLKAEPKPIVPTGYGILDTAAKTAIINPNQIFPAASTHKLYQLAVAFKYDEKVCSGIPVAPSTGPTRPTAPQPLAPAPTAPKPTGEQSPAPAEVKPQFEKPPAPSNKPQPGAQQSPQPSPKPATKPSPSPQPKPAAEQSPSPQPKPAPEKSPQPEAVPSPASEVSPQPEAAPSPAGEKSPQPEAAPSPAAEVSPSPEAAPSPAAEVGPSPATAN